MEKCPETLSVLPEGFEELPVEEANKILAEAKVKDSAVYFECKRKQEEEARWINSQD